MNAASVVPSPRRVLPAIAAILLVSFSLHVVPQALRALVDPAWSMLTLMIVDALLIAWLARSWGSLRAATLIAAVLALTIAARQQAFAALPSISLNLLLAAAFGATLRRGSTPLLVRVARAAYPEDIKPEFVRYLSRLTLAWTVFFLAMAAASLLLALYATFATWSLFVNVLYGPLIGAVFVVEWAVRRLYFPHLPARNPQQIAVSVFSYIQGGRKTGERAATPMTRTAAEPE